VEVLKMQLKTIGMIYTMIDYDPEIDKLRTNIFDIVLNKDFLPAMMGLTPKLNVMITYWDKRSKRDVLMLKLPDTGIDLGVFASRSHNRPNPISQTIAEIVGIRENTLTVMCSDQIEDCPVLDIKPYIPILDAEKRSQ
jgi:formylmethanofuran dehydrogenase subunit E